MFYLAVMLWLPTYNFIPERLQFEDYRSQLDFKLLSKDTIQVKDAKRVNLLVEMRNESEHTWKNPSFLVNFINTNGELVNVEQAGRYSFSLPAKDTITISLKVPFYEEYENARIELKLQEMTNHRF